MSLIRIDHDPSRRQLAVFGLLWAVFFGVIGWIVWAKTDSLAPAGIVWTAAAVVPLLGAVVPGLMRIVYLAMAYVAFPIGFVLSHVILALVYYLVLTPIGLLMRLFGYDPMHRRFDPDASTYWVTRQQDGDVERYFRQF
jgi:hypothetical protein